MNNFRFPESITPVEFEENPVWEFSNTHEGEFDETILFPVVDVPVASMENRIIGSKVRFSSGANLWAMVGNVYLYSHIKTKTFMSMSLYIDDKWIRIARYFDEDYEEGGPKNIAKIMNMSLEKIFPIEYDFSKWISGSEDVVRGRILVNPEPRFSKFEIMRMTLQ